MQISSGGIKAIIYLVAIMALLDLLNEPAVRSQFSC
ncbi:TPA: hypothetical protein JBG74_09055 [Legionella pneumophila]|uniref:Uncharacterized protein n=2 Tax=Legionella pneumophila TaxID=446 RepID=Q5ZYK4_LEGPH|nr:hypothetical protein lpg0368 [Legionella pneumophila subsp. pneumophila str. Philadelphia 1]AEW50647.1 hypothetical protein lp12_0369 [Legionella pneumophila subsp. pneumophila ATCC 43290]PNL79249.1 hypothetical protein A6J41_015235 [Legionella pneumophila subsp. pneumophila]PPK34736.1 hypothetical protein C3927_01115 [Legionella pneumophila]OOD06975.1 hypothetical protein BWO97_06960 [Legionella pneumophila subsp. pneumophila ATCC 43290]